jgi:hypothetical protein
MKNVSSSLVLCLALLISSCAFGMGRGVCQSPVLPTRPTYAVCVANATGQAFCYDGQNETTISANNLVCYSAQDNQKLEVWIKDTIRACSQ